jgi:ABC-type branched-subunit amino acid transport system substrate-binding protein
MAHRRDRSRWWNRGRVLAALVAVAVGLTGCAALGSKKSASATACDAPGITARNVNIGAIFPNTGNNATVFSAYRAGVDARLGVANDAGGVGGRAVSYSWADDQGLAGNNLGAAQELVNQGVFSIVELSTATAGGASWLNQRNVPVVGSGLDEVWSHYRNMFSYTYLVAAGPSISTWGDYVKAQGGTRAAVLYSAFSDASRILTNQWSSSLKAAGIHTDLIEATPNVTSAATVVAEIRAHQDDTLTGVVDTVLFAQIAMGLNASPTGHMKVILSASGYDKAFLNAFGKNLPGLSTFISYAPFEEHVAPAQKFLAAMSEYSPQVQPNNNEIALEGWIDADMTLTGLAAAGACPTRVSFMAALRNDSHYDAGGLLVSPVNLKTNFGQLNRCYTFLKIAPTGARWDVVKPAPSCGHPVQ